MINIHFLILYSFTERICYNIHILYRMHLKMLRDN